MDGALHVHVCGDWGGVRSCTVTCPARPTPASLQKRMFLEVSREGDAVGSHLDVGGGGSQRQAVLARAYAGAGLAANAAAAVAALVAASSAPSLVKKHTLMNR